MEPQDHHPQREVGGRGAGSWKEMKIALLTGLDTYPPICRAGFSTNLCPLAEAQQQRGFR